MMLKVIRDKYDYPPRVWRGAEQISEYQQINSENLPKDHDHGQATYKFCLLFVFANNHFLRSLIPQNIE